VKSKGQVLGEMEAKVDGTLVKLVEEEIAKMFPKHPVEDES
jgi:hypothetical protein